MKKAGSMIGVILLLFVLHACTANLEKEETSSTPDSMVVTSPSPVSGATSPQNTENPPTQEDNVLHIEVVIHDRTFSTKLYDNETVKAFLSQLPMTVDMSELNGNEKFYYLSDKLPVDASRPSSIRTGDLMLYGADCLVLFYKDFSSSYSYTSLGYIEDPEGLTDALGNREVQVTFRQTQ